jgi:succinoglycan biosynthesis protein ExoA
VTTNSVSIQDSRTERTPIEPAASFISVIVPARNEANNILRTLAQLVAQDYDPRRFEILVVDGRSTDGTRGIVENFIARHPNVRLLDNPRRLSSAARNVAVENSRGDIIVLVDGHCEFPDDRYFRQLDELFARSGADCLGRPQPQDVRSAADLQRAIAAARSSRLGHHPDSHVYSTQEGFVPAHSVAVAYRRSVFEKVGRFDENFDACEDVEFNHRVDSAALRCFFSPKIAVHYAPRRSLRGLFRQLFRYGRGRVRLLRKHPDTFSLKSLLPALFVVGVTLGAVLCWLSSWLAVPYLAAVGAYCAIILAASALISAKRRDAGILPWLPLVFATIHISAGAGILFELLSGIAMGRKSIAR